MISANRLRLYGRPMLAAFVVLFALLLSAATSQAAQSHIFQKTFNASDAPAGTATPLQGPLGLAIDNSGTVSDGHVYVGDTGHGAVDVFDSTGKYLSQITGFSTPYGLAVDQSDGDLYVADLSGVVKKFDGAGNVVSTFGNEGRLTGAATPQGGFEPTGVAVDPNTHDLYVSDYGNAVVDIFTSSGEYKSQFPVAPSVYMLAIDSQGNLFAADGSEVIVYNDVTGDLNTSYGEGSGVLDSGGSIGVGVDPATDDVYVNDEDHIAEYDQTGAFVSDFGQGNLSGDRDIGIGDSAARVYVTNQSAANVAIFGPPVIVPDVTTGPVINPGQTSGTLTGELDPAGGGNATNCRFEYGTSTSYGSELPCNPGAPYETATSVQAIASGLTSEVTYHYRLVVTNANGTNFGQDRRYTPHAVVGLTTEPATNITANGARLNGSFVGNGEDTHYYFQWGTSTGYGHATTPSPGVDAGSGTGFMAEFADLASLAPQTTYHYRIVASNSEGTSFGEDATFTTPPAVSGLSTMAPTNVTSTAATLNGGFTGNGEDTHYYFEWGPGVEYGHTTAVPPGEDAGSAAGPRAVAANLTGLTAASTYSYRFVASNSTGTTFGNSQTFLTPPAAPGLTESASNVTSDSASLHAEINPGGGETKYHFEYATEAEFKSGESYSRATPEGTLSSHSAPQNVEAQLGGLAPGTVYHWRVVATNATGTTDGLDRTFTTYPFIPVLNDPCPNAHVRQQTGAAFLLDCRAYELVSAADTGGYDVESSLIPGQTPFGGYPEAEGRVLYGVHDGGIPGTDHPTNRGVDPYIATRGENGWSTEYVGVPANNAFAANPFSSAPSGVDESLDTLAFGSPGGCSPCFEGGYTGVPVRLPDGELVQGMVPAANVIAPPPSAVPDGYVAKDLSADGSHFVFGSTSLFAEGGNNSTGDVSIYDHDLKTGETHVVSNTPAGTPLPCLPAAGACHSPGEANGIAELDISANGSRILVAQKVATDADGNVYWHLYMDIGDASRSIDLTPGTTSGVLYDGMSADGSKVFFTTKDKLAASDTDTSADLYMAEVSPSGATLTRVSSGEGGSGDTNNCEPVSNSNGEHWNTLGSDKDCDVVAIGGGGGVASGNGSVYFLSPEQLQTGKGVQNQPNLYYSAAPGSAPRFVATLSPEDPLVVDSLKEAATRRTADFQTTPNGGFAAFGSTLPLPLGTQYDNAGHSEIYRYDSSTEALVCASCDPTGVEPSFDSALASNGLSLTDDGRVFFTTGEPLVARDQDNKKDAYEWEEGKLELISAGNSSFDSELLSVSADGKDAYFYTRDSLAPQDQNGQTMKIYDAREGGGFPYQPPSPPCAASDECHGAGSPAPAPAEIRSLVSGPGNVPAKSAKQCKKGTVRRHGKCVRKSHPKVAKHHRHHKRRAGHRGKGGK